MSVGLQFSRIEVFRVRNHGNQILRLYEFNEDGNTLSTLYTVHRGFFIGKNFDTSEGAADFLLTLDINYSLGLTEAILGKMYMVDLINPDTGNKRRYKINTAGAPLPDDKRNIFGLHAAYNDTKAII